VPKVFKVNLNRGEKIMKCNSCGASDVTGVFCCFCGSTISRNNQPPQHNFEQHNQFANQNQFTNQNMGMPPISNQNGFPPVNNNANGFPPVGNTNNFNAQNNFSHSSTNFNNNDQQVASAQGQAASALTCGILSFLLLPFILGLVALINGAVATARLGRLGKPRGAAIAGLVLGILNLIAVVVIIVILMSVLDWFWIWF